MLFNSTVFLKFFAAFLLGYWLVRRNLQLRNLFLLLASYLFYGWWDVRFLSLILFSTLLDYGVGMGLGYTREPARRRALLTLSLVGNLGILGFFKYFHFFTESLIHLLEPTGWQVHAPTLQILLPVGISFYTFQTLSYTLDVYRGEMRPTRDLTAFAAYVAFFPQLVAGPIERARNLLPQFHSPRTIGLAGVESGLWLILWGMFKKVVVADNLAPLVDMVYHPEAGLDAAAVILSTTAFGIQIYGDFSGYSDIARGLARLLGFELMLNFDLPYAAVGLRDFWRRWHISLSTWLRDYLYIPLGGNRSGRWTSGRNILVTFLLGGLWHGAAWNFLGWGLYHGLGVAAEHAIAERKPQRCRRLFRWVGWPLTMLFVGYGWLLFRAESWSQIGRMTLALGEVQWPPWGGSYLVNLAWFTAPLILMELWQLRRRDALIALRLPLQAKGILQGLLLLAIFFFWERAGTPFIYFQF